MAFLIINSIPIETINSLNSRFKLSLARINISSKMDIEDYQEREFDEVKKFMESNKPVEYECNKY